MGVRATLIGLGVAAVFCAATLGTAAGARGFDRLFLQAPTRHLAKAGTEIAYVHFADPGEQAFEAEVPQFWKVQGGMLRRGNAGVALSLRATSPDGKITVFYGDPEIFGYIPTDEVAIAMWVGEGGEDPVSGLTVLRYLPGTEYAANYAQRTCPVGNVVRLVDRRERPDFVKSVERVYITSTASTKQTLTAGEASFACEKEGQKLVGYVFAGTLLSSVQGTSMGMWNVSPLVGYLAPEDQVPLASSVLSHILQTMIFRRLASQEPPRPLPETIVHGELDRIQREAFWSRGPRPH